MDIPHPIIGSYPVRTGNAVRPLVDGAAAFRRIGEVIDRARHSVWLTVAFYTPDFRMPDGRGSLFDVLDRAVARGLDVRVIFWRWMMMPKLLNAGMEKRCAVREPRPEWVPLKGMSAISDLLPPQAYAEPG